MENRSKVVVGGTASGCLDSVWMRREDWRLAQAAHRDLLSIGMPRVNVLLVGTDTVVRTLLDMLEPALVRPVVTWHPGEVLQAALTEDAATLVLRDVDGLTTDEQTLLLQWLERGAGRTQVLSTVSSPLGSRVAGNTFLDTLYYRLNTVCLDVTGRSSLSTVTGLNASSFNE